MSDTQPDAETLAFAARVFQAAREGDTGALEPLLAQGLPPTSPTTRATRS